MYVLSCNRIWDLLFKQPWQTSVATRCRYTANKKFSSYSIIFICRLFIDSNVIIFTYRFFLNIYLSEKEKEKLIKNFPNKFRRLIVEYLSIYNIYIWNIIYTYLILSLRHLYTISKITRTFLFHIDLLFYITFVTFENISILRTYN